MQLVVRGFSGQEKCWWPSSRARSIDSETKGGARYLAGVDFHTDDALFVLAPRTMIAATDGLCLVTRPESQALAGRNDMRLSLGSSPGYVFFWTGRSKERYTYERAFTIL